jgi:hypothetical protein
MELKGYDYDKKCEVCDNLIPIRKSLNKRSSFSVKLNRLVYPEKTRFCSVKCRMYWRNILNNSMKNTETKNKISGKNNYAWLGSKVKYFGLHSWIRKQIGSRPEFCGNCGVKGCEIKNKRWSIQFCNISGEYKRNLDDWLLLCIACHRKHDNAKRTIKEIKCLDCSAIIKTKFLKTRKFCDECKRKKHNTDTKIRNKRKRLEKKKLYGKI